MLYYTRENDDGKQRRRKVTVVGDVVNIPAKRRN